MSGPRALKTPGCGVPYTSQSCHLTEENSIMSILKIGTTSTVVRAGVSAALAIAAVGGLATAGQAATAVSSQAAMTLSSSTGKESGTQAVIGTAAVNKFYTGKVAVQFQSTTSLTGSCATTYPATSTTIIAATSTSIINAKKVSIVVPTLGSANTTATWLICAYNGTLVTSTLLAKAGYTSAGVPTLATLPAGGVSVPTYGGTTISVTGTNFLAPLTATLGGRAMTDINIVDSTLFTATAPPNSVGTAPLTVNSVGGSATTFSSAANPYTYTNALLVSPTTAASGTTAVLDVQGVGFNNTAFTTTTGLDPDAVGAHVYLLDTTAYSAASYVRPSGGPPLAGGVAKAHAEKSECINVSVISDTELVCTLNLANGYRNATPASVISTVDATGGPTVNGLYTIAVVSDGAAQGGTVTGTSSGNVFTVAAF
jgi:hypothetical protein